MPSFAKRLLSAALIVVVLIALNAYMSDEGLFGFGIPPYYARVIMLAGINVILAVSLNLITGFTGQFSIGHAGFMDVGAYSSAYLTVYHAQGWEKSLEGLVGASVAHVLIFLLHRNSLAEGCDRIRVAVQQQERCRAAVHIRHW